jgi:hypothetical protein
MNCRQAQREIALLIGEDLSEDDRREEVEQHLKRCPGCREHRARAASALAAITTAEPQSTFESVHSLWPGVRRRLAQPPAPVPRQWDWKAWAPFAAGVAACASLLLIVGGNDHNPPQSIHREVVPLYPPFAPSIRPGSGHTLNENGVPRRVDLKIENE